MTEEGLRPELLEPPSAQFPPPPIETAEQVLPFGSLRWDDFEKLCLRVARLEGNPRDSRRYGVPGQAQGGIDLYSALPAGRYATYQCKRYETVRPGDIKRAVDAFLRGPWSRTSDRFVLCTSDSAVSTQLGDAIETQRRRLGRRKKPIEFEVLDADELSLTLKGQREIVVDFFGPRWAARFFGEPALPDEPDVRDMVKELLARGTGRAQFVSNDWAPDSLRPKLDDLRRNDPDVFARLNDLLGNPPEPALIRAAADTAPGWLLEGDSRTWDVFARIAQANGEWRAAAIAWERKAERLDGSARAGALVSAAVAAGVGGNEDERQAGLQRAAEIDERNPRLVLALLSEDEAPADQLKLLATLRTEDPEELGLISAQETIAHLLTPNLDAARASLDKVRRHIPDSALAEGLQISLTVQEGRLAALAGRSVDRGALRGAAAAARSLRERMTVEKRWSEATRILMLAADVEALLWDRAAAAKVLREALPEERETTEQKLVLASCAAGRALDFELALEFLEGAEDGADTQLIRFEALEEIGTPPEREIALEGLDRIVRGGGRRAAEAAFVRLAATIGSRDTPWSDEAAIRLRTSGYERAAVSAEAYYRIKNEGFEAAERVLKPHGNAPWALATLLRVSLSKHAPRDAAVRAAERLLSVGPSHQWRVEAARGLARGQEFGRAREVLVAVAREPGAPEAVRADAYELLMHVVGNDQDDWGFAAELYSEWINLAPTDARAPQWGPRVANRSRTRSGSGSGTS